MKFPNEAVMLTRQTRHSWSALNGEMVWSSDLIEIRPSAEGKGARAMVRAVEIQAVDSFFCRFYVNSASQKTIKAEVRLSDSIHGKEVWRREYEIPHGQNTDMNFTFDAVSGVVDFEFKIFGLEAAGEDFASIKWPALYNAEHPIRLRHAPFVDTENVVCGYEGWLFLTADTNANLEQLSGKRPLSAQELEAWRKEFVARREFMKAQGLQYRFLIAPNKETVYRDYLPKYIEAAEVSNADRLVKALDGLVDIVFPVKELQRTMPQKHSYMQCDTHWNDYGSFLAAKAVIDSFPSDLGIHPLSDSEASFKDSRTAGDLGSKCEPPVVGQHIVGEPLHPATIVFDNKVNNTARMMLYHMPDTADRKLLVFGDSFSMNMLKWLAPHFRYVLFVHTTSVDRGLVQRFKPDAVLSEVVERFFIAPPQPMEEYSHQTTLQKKLSKLNESHCEQLIQAMDACVATDVFADYLRQYHMDIANMELSGRKVIKKHSATCQ